MLCAVSHVVQGRVPVMDLMCKVEDPCPQWYPLRGPGPEGDEEGVEVVEVPATSLPASTGPSLTGSRPSTGASCVERDGVMRCLSCFSLMVLINLYLFLTCFSVIIQGIQYICGLF